mmetsp:Transcript_29540/g.77379  ORF Transcript_29540/g.77379 Transcript_29540/m.77379 type:complete len:204 (-) Transcript_29540:593-1204(-)
MGKLAVHARSVHSFRHARPLISPVCLRQHERRATMGSQTCETLSASLTMPPATAAVAAAAAGAALSATAAAGAVSTAASPAAAPMPPSETARDQARKASPMQRARRARCLELQNASCHRPTCHACLPTVAREAASWATSSSRRAALPRLAQAVRTARRQFCALAASTRWASARHFLLRSSALRLPSMRNTAQPAAASAAAMSS